MALRFALLPLYVLRFTFYASTMAREDDNLFDKAEGLARRVLERLGAKLDDRIAGEAESLSSKQISEIASRIERAIEDALKPDKAGVRRVAPNRLMVLFTYEDASRLGPKYKDALAAELRAVALEYINNRRYEIAGPVSIQIASDLFSKTTLVRAMFDEAAARPSKTETAEPGQCAVTLIADDGRSFKLVLKAGEDPAYIGRASGIAARIDDASLSRLHCSVALRASGQVVISDLGSSNGSILNGKQLAPHEAHLLKPGDVIELGDVLLAVAEIA
jgi:hypothetical protein